MLFIFHDSDHEFDKLTQSIFLNPFSINFFFQSHSPTTQYPFNFFFIIIISCLGILCHIYSIQIHANEARNVDSCQWTLTLAWLILC
jgi:formate hydrogenlyase subunit 3/multisubunit Na+/H+ antiporter MnhD subunit